MSHANDDSQEMMQRRELLRRAAWLLGGAVSAPAALAILQGCSARESAGESAGAALKTLSAAQMAIVAEIAEIMIPKTDTGGAKDAGVPVFIDATLAAVYPQKDQERFKAGLGEFEPIARASGKPFLEREPVERVDFVKQCLVVALGPGARRRQVHPHGARAHAAGLFHVAGGHHREYGVRSRSDGVPRMRAVVTDEETRILGMTRSQGVRQ